jgi:hypothetical protein
VRDESARRSAQIVAPINAHLSQPIDAEVAAQIEERIKAQTGDQQVQGEVLGDLVVCVSVH